MLERLWKSAKVFCDIIVQIVGVFCIFAVGLVTFISLIVGVGFLSYSLFGVLLNNPEAAESIYEIILVQGFGITLGLIGGLGILFIVCMVLFLIFSWLYWIVTGEEIQA